MISLLIKHVSGSEGSQVGTSLLEGLNLSTRRREIKEQQQTWRERKKAIM